MIIMTYQIKASQFIIDELNEVEKQRWINEIVGR